MIDGAFVLGVQLLFESAGLPFVGCDETHTVFKSLRQQPFFNSQAFQFFKLSELLIIC